jgi:hypothetical protein
MLHTEQNSIITTYLVALQKTRNFIKNSIFENFDHFEPREG